MFDPKKPYKLRNNEYVESVRIICTDFLEKRPIIALLKCVGDEFESCIHYYSNGNFYNESCEHYNDLINIED